MAEIRMVDVCKYFDKNKVIDHLDLTIEDSPLIRTEAPRRACYRAEEPRLAH